MLFTMRSIFIKYRLFLFAGLLMLALSWASYSGNAAHTLLQWDDAPYITNNTWVTNPSLESLGAMFTESKVANWHPLTWLSYIPEYYFCGTDAYCYKNTNIFLHGLNSFLVFLLSGLVFCSLKLGRGGEAFELRRLSNPDFFIPSLLSGVLFCVHPQHAESVIWVAERKDLLSTLFYLLALFIYIFERISGSPRLALLPFLLFILAVMSKSMAITLPAILVLLDFTLLGRWPEKGSEAVVKNIVRIALVEKIHYYIVAIAVAITTILSQSVTTLEQPTLYERLMISAAAIEHYLFIFIAPIGLSPFYPVEIIASSIVEYWSVIVVLFALLGLLIYGGNRRLSVLFIAYFLITLSPVIGIIKVGDQAYADRYTYLTMIGFYMLFAFGVSRVIAVDRRFRIPFFLGLSVLVGILSLSTRQYKNTWQSDLLLWETIEASYPSTSITISNKLGLAHLAEADYSAAKEAFETSIDLDANRPRAYVNLAAVYQRVGDTENFLNTYVSGVANNPDNADLITSAGFGFLAASQEDQALEYFIQALELELNFPPAVMGVGNILLRRGEAENAISMLELVPPDSDVEFPAKLLLAQAYAAIDKSQSRVVLEELRAKYDRDEEIDSMIDFVDRL